MDSQWLKMQFQFNPGKTKAELATALGLEPPAVSKILNGTRQIKAQEYFLMRKFFGLPVDGESATSSHLKVRRNETSNPSSFEDRDSTEWMTSESLVCSETEKTRAFQVNEDCMRPHYCRGDRVLVDLTDRKPNPPGIFMVSDGFGNMLRHCEYTPKSAMTKIKISAPAPGFQPQVLNVTDFLILGRVIAKLQMV